MREARPTYEIRIAGPEDFEAVAALWHKSASQPGVGPPSMPSELDLLRRVKIHANADWHLLIAEENRHVVGMLALKLAERVLDQLFVCPSHFGSGLGLALFNRAREEMPLGFSLHTASTNSRARTFYERQGMNLGKEGNHPRTGHPVVYYHMPPEL